MWVESAVGRGSTFHFTAQFGVAKEAMTPSVVPRMEAELLHLPVIIVDDNSTNRTILSELTSSWGMDVRAADSGASALAAMREADAMGERLRLAIIDGHMPGMDGFELAEQIRQDPRLAGAVIMMLSSTGQAGDAARCRQLGISAYLIKPIRKPELLSAILTALGQAPADAVRSAGKAKDPEPIGSGLRILLVEDNRINQTVALRMLEKMGHQAVLANNGLEALEQLSSKEFDLVLMDVQMPEMDGLTATKQIRAMEKDTGRHIAIVAMTARAMRGDREICLAAGMDAYLSKPIDREELGKHLAADAIRR